MRHRGLIIAGIAIVTVLGVALWWYIEALMGVRS